MGDFDQFHDGAFQLKTEGELIKLEFKKGVPLNGQGTVEWNIPHPAAGCDSGMGGVYAGIVILLSTEPMTAENIPQDGKVYIADPTGDFNLHTGDKIGNALVVGAIYECEEKNRGELLTTSFVVSNLSTDVSYYVAGYATDCQFRYHADGVRSYSDRYGDNVKAGTQGQQLISFGLNSILPTDATDLLPGVIYSFDIVVDREVPTGKDFDVVEINVNGVDVGTYDLLVNEVNNQIKQHGNPPISPVAPNAGTFFYDTVAEKLWQFDGYTYSLVPAIIETTDPTLISNGTYWYDTSTKVLSVRLGGSWTPTNTIIHPTDPKLPTCADYWFDGTSGKKWNGTTWCDVNTVVSDISPDTCMEPICGTYWFDQKHNILYERDSSTVSWIETSAVSWNDDPTNLPVGTYWFNLTDNTLHTRVSNNWTDITNTPGVLITEATPTSPSSGNLWYVPSTEILSQYNELLTVWEPLPVLVWPGDPTKVESCTLWWRTSDNVLFAWNITTDSWTQVANFVLSIIDPALSPVVALDSLWFDIPNNKLNKWDGSGWEIVNTTIFSVDPVTSGNGTIWYDDVNNIFYVWGGNIWSVIDPTQSLNDPSLLPNGIYWYDTTNNALYVRNGITWIVVTFTTVPLIPARGTRWYNSVSGTLNEWNGKTYEEIGGIAKLSITAHGQLVIRNSSTGSGTIIFIPVPSGANLTGVGSVTINDGYADFVEAGNAPATTTYTNFAAEYTYPTREVPVSGFLWEQVTPAAIVQQPQEGTDTNSGLPSYEVLGVGTDGTPDERRKLADDIRTQLGHPVITVELTPHQIDTAIRRALESFRKRSSMAYTRGFYFLDAKPHESRYALNNKRIGYDKIVNVTAVHRFSSAFLSTAQGAGAYGQVVLQHLYNMGTYDLTSFHLVSQYIEQLEHLFATRIVFSWDEMNRVLDIYQSFTRPERMLMDCQIERTEQQLLKDRYVKTWIERYAISQCQFMLAEIRGKYGSLPGAGGGISLNATELQSKAETTRLELLQQLDDYLVQDLENVGMLGTFTIG